MLAEFARVGAPDEVVGRATWAGARVVVSAGDDDARAAIGRIFRSTAVLVDDASLRTFGTQGPELLAPGSLRWFLAAAESRAPAEGLAVMIVPEAQGAMGWDPAGAYRPFPVAVERLDRTPSPGA